MPAILSSRPPVSAVRRPRPGASLAERAPDAAEQWHPGRNNGLTPSDVSGGSQLKAWWSCPAGTPEDPHTWQAAVTDRVPRLIKGQARPAHGCPFCAGRRRPPQANESLAALYPGLALEWDSKANAPLAPSDLRAGSNLKVFWRCPAHSHSYQALVANRTGA